MTHVRWRLGALAVSLVAGQAVIAQVPACPGHTSGIWVAVAGKDRYQLGEARRIPPGELVTLRGYPRPPQLPVVTLRPAEETAPINLAVTADSVCGWSAGLPALRPNAKAEIKVTAFTELSDSEKSVVKDVFVAMLSRFAEGLSTDSIRTSVSPEEYTRSAQAYLARSFHPDSTLRGFVLIPQGRQAAGTLGAQLVRLIAESDSFGVADVPASYQKHLNALKDALQDRAAIDAMPREQRRAVLALTDAVGYTDFSRDHLVRRRRVASMMTRSPPLLPLSDETAMAVRALIADTARNALKRAALEASVDTLTLSLEERLPALFRAMYAFTKTSYQLMTVSGPLFLGDLLRYGTVDFLTGQIWNRNNGGAQNRGFLTFSFFPTGPQSRTPENLVGDPTESGRWAASVGYSVTGGKKDGDDEPEDFFLAGVTVRANRYVSATFGFVSPKSGGGLRCCFAGIAGDVTALPFLSDLFAVNPNVGK